MYSYDTLGFFFIKTRIYNVIIKTRIYNGSSGSIYIRENKICLKVSRKYTLDLSSLLKSYMVLSRMATCLLIFKKSCKPWGEGGWLNVNSNYAYIMHICGEETYKCFTRPHL